MYKFLEDQNAVGSRLRLRDIESYKLVTRGVSELMNDHWSRFSDDCRDMIKSLLVADPNKRPTTDQIKDHLWFKTQEEREQAIIHREI